MKREDFCYVNASLQDTLFIFTDYLRRIGIIRENEFVKDFQFSWKTGFKFKIEKED